MEFSKNDMRKKGSDKCSATLSELVKMEDWP